MEFFRGGFYFVSTKIKRANYSLKYFSNNRVNNRRLHIFCIFCFIIFCILVSLNEIKWNSVNSVFFEILNSFHSCVISVFRRIGIYVSVLRRIQWNLYIKWNPISKKFSTQNFVFLNYFLSINSLSGKKFIQQLMYRFHCMYSLILRFQSSSFRWFWNFTFIKIRWVKRCVPGAHGWSELREVSSWLLQAKRGYPWCTWTVLALRLQRAR